MVMFSMKVSLESFRVAQENSSEYSCNSSVHQYSDSPKFSKRAINVFSLYLSSSSSVNQFLK